MEPGGLEAAGHGPASDMEWRDLCLGGGVEGWSFGRWLEAQTLNAGPHPALLVPMAE